MGIRKRHTSARQFINRGLWLGFRNSPRGWEAHLFFTIQSRQVTQISLMLLNMNVRKKRSQKHMSWGKQAYEYVAFFFPNTNESKLPMKLKCLVWFDFNTKNHQIEIWASTVLHVIVVVEKQPLQWSKGNILTLWDGNVSIISCWNYRWNRYILPKCLDFIKLPFLARSNSSSSVGLVWTSNRYRGVSPALP